MKIYVFHITWLENWSIGTDKESYKYPWVGLMIVISSLNPIKTSSDFGEIVKQIKEQCDGLTW